METLKPSIYDYKQMPEFVKDMISWKKNNEKHFSVRRKCENLRRCSPTLISLITSGKRSISVDRIDDIVTLLDLTPKEKWYFSECVTQTSESLSPGKANVKKPKIGKKTYVSPNILSNWLNIYVKDAFRFPLIQRHPDELYRLLGGIAAKPAIEKSLHFLLKHGYLVKKEDGTICESSQVHVAESPLSDEKIRNFHRKTLKIAGDAIDQFPKEERIANALIVPLDEKGFSKLSHMIDTFGLELQNFAQTDKSVTGRLYQLVINLSPTGGRSNDTN